MKMKKEKDIVKFFNHYSEQMLPTDGEQFIEKLKQNMDSLPVPSAFSKMEQEMSKEYAERLLAKLKKDYKRSKIDVIISCIFISIIIATAVLAISTLGIPDTNSIMAIGMLTIVTLASIILLYHLLPLHS